MSISMTNDYYSFTYFLHSIFNFLFSSFAFILVFIFCFIFPVLFSTFYQNFNFLFYFIIYFYFYVFFYSLFIFEFFFRCILTPNIVEFNRLVASAILYYEKNINEKKSNIKEYKTPNNYSLEKMEEILLGLKSEREEIKLKYLCVSFGNLTILKKGNKYRF